MEVFVGDVISIGEQGIAFELVEAPQEQRDSYAQYLDLLQTKVCVCGGWVVCVWCVCGVCVVCVMYVM